MDFTREPIIETIITPKEGFKLVLKSSKDSSSEEFSIDALEIVSFGNSFFFRSIEHPKAFLVPVQDYQVFELRENRMILKNSGPDRAIKIGGGREGILKAPREEKSSSSDIIRPSLTSDEQALPESSDEGRTDIRIDKKKDRRRQQRKKRGAREEASLKQETGIISESLIPPLEEGQIVLTPPEPSSESLISNSLNSSFLSALLQPPPTLISESIKNYRENIAFKNAFFLSEEEQYKPHKKAEQLLNDEKEMDTESVGHLEDDQVFEEDSKKLEHPEEEHQVTDFFQIEESFSELAGSSLEETEDFDKNQEKVPLFLEAEEDPVKIEEPLI